MNSRRRHPYSRVVTLILVFCSLGTWFLVAPQYGYKISLADTSLLFCDIPDVRVTVANANSTLVSYFTDGSANANGTNGTNGTDVVRLDLETAAVVEFLNRTWIFQMQHETVEPEPEPTPAPDPEQKPEPPFPMPYSHRDGVESDKEVSYLRYLISGLAINNTVIIVPANVGFIAQALNFNCRVRSLGVTNVLFWALDETAAEILRSYSAPTYYNPSFFSVANLEKYHALNYNRMMSERPKFWRMVMRTGYNMLFMDADIAVIRNPMESIVGDADLEGQTDDYSVRECNDMDHLPAMCAGAFFLKSSERSVALLNHMERQLLDGRELCEHPSEENKDIPRACEDQEALNFFIQDRSLSRVVNRNLNDTFSEEQDSRLTVRFIPVDEYLNGHVLSRATLVSDPTTMAFKDAEGHKGEAFIPAMVHVNGYTGKDKQERLMLHGWWHLNADFTCSYEKDIMAVDEGASLL